MKIYKMLPLVVVPFMVISGLVLGYLTIAQEWNYPLASFAILLISFTAVFTLEKYIPLKADWNLPDGTIWAEVLHFIISVGLFDALGKTAALWLVLSIKNTLFESSQIWESLPFWITFVIANIIGEFLPYLYHRISHIGKPGSLISQFLWQIHSIHHIPQKLNWFKTNWVHPINMFLNTLLKVGPLLFLGFSDEIIFLVGILHIIISYISHANIKTVTGVLDYIIVTPQIHHFHHSKVKDEAKNFGSIIPFWDLVFGTYYNRPGMVGDVGTNEIHYTYPNEKDYLKQIIFPFIALKYCCRNDKGLEAR